MSRPTWRVLARVALFACVASPALAEEIAPGIVTSDTSLTSGRGFPVWIEASGGFIAGFSGSEAHCYDANGSPARTSMGAERWRNQRVAVDRSTDQLYVVSVQWQDFVVNAPVLAGIQIARTDCGTTFEVLHESFAGDEPAWDLDYAWRDDSGVFQQALAPMSPGGTLFLPSSDGVYTWSVSSPQAPPQLLLAYNRLSDAVLAAAVDPWDSGKQATPDGLTWRMRSAFGLDDGGLLATLDDSISGRGHTFLIGPDGEASLLTRESQFPAMTWSLPGARQIPVGSSYSAELHAIVSFAAGGVSFIPLDFPQVIASFPQPTVPQTPADGAQVVALFTSGAGGKVFAVEAPPGSYVARELSFDLLRLDVDGDGLRRHQEDLLGTDDRRWDSDDDGYSDSVEHWVYDTSPTSASSAPSVSAPPLLGISNMLGDVRDDESSLSMTSLVNLGEPFTTASFGYGYICPKRSGQPVCFDHEGVETPPSFPFEGRGDLLPVASSDGSVLAFTDVALGQTYGFHNQPPNFYYGLDTSDSVIRKATGMEFPIVQPSRTECPFALNDADRRCAADGYSYPGTRFTEVVGSEPASESVFVTLRTTQHTVIAAANVDRVEPLGDGRMWGIWRPEQIVPIASYDSFLVNAVAQTNAGPARRWWIADANLRPVEEFLTWSPSPFNPSSTPLGGSYREGIITKVGLQFAKPNGAFGAGGSCTSGGANGGFTCGKPNTMEDPFVPSAIETGAQVVPIPAGIEPGEVIFPGSVVGVSLGVSPYGGVLARITRSGAVAPWLTFQDLRRLANGEPSAFAGLTFVDLAATTGPTRICMVEGHWAEAGNLLMGRVWELELDAQGLPVSFRLVVDDQVNAPGACGYDDSGALHWVVSNALVSEVGATVPTSVEKPRHLERVAGNWVVIGDLSVDPSDGAALTTKPHAEASCIDGSGAEQMLGDVLALSSFGGLTYLLDSYGEVVLRRSADVCDGRGPLEHFLEPIPQAGFPDVANIWNEIYEGLLEINGSTSSEYVPWRLRSASLAIRPDGVLLAAPGGFAFGRGPRPPRGLWRMQGTLYPDDPNDRIEELDPRRREVPLVNLMSAVQGVDAMVVIPGADPWPESDYEYLVTAKPPPRGPFAVAAGGDMGSDVGLTDMGPTSEPEEDKRGCHCGVASSADSGFGAGLLLLLAAFRGRRK